MLATFLESLGNIVWKQIVFYLIRKEQLQSRNVLLTKEVSKKHTYFEDGLYNRLIFFINQIIVSTTNSQLTLNRKHDKIRFLSEDRRDMRDEIYKNESWTLEQRTDRKHETAGQNFQLTLDSDHDKI